MNGRKAVKWQAKWDVARRVGAISLLLEDGEIENQEELDGGEFAAIFSVLRVGNVVFSDDYTLLVKSSI